MYWQCYAILYCWAIRTDTFFKGKVMILIWTLRIYKGF